MTLLNFIQVTPRGMHGMAHRAGIATRCSGARAGSRLRLAACALGMAMFIASPGAAHEYWLAPSRYLPGPDHAIELSALAGTGFRGERKPFTATHCVRLSVRGVRTLDLTPVARDGAYRWARFAPSDSGGAMFAFESDFTPITLPATEFARYLAAEGLDAPLASRASDPNRASSRGRERFRRCAKTWVQGNDAARATTPIGLPLEIVPALAPGLSGRLKVRVLWQGRPLAGALVRAWRTVAGADGSPSDPEARDSVGVAWQTRTDAQGEVTAHVDLPGEWLLSVVQMVPSGDAAIADWESTWASLTFERPAFERRKRSPR